MMPMQSDVQTNKTMVVKVSKERFSATKHQPIVERQQNQALGIKICSSVIENTSTPTYTSTTFNAGD